MKLAAVRTLKQSKNGGAAARPIVFLTIANGAAHTRAAEAIARIWRKNNPQIPAQIIEVSEFMSRTARFTHVTAYLWLVKHAPRIWGKIDDYQKRQPRTSPEWFYRRECRKLFDLIREIRPSAIIATEVGCGEIAALIKRDLQFEVPLVAVNLDYEADRAWIQPETDLYCLATGEVEKKMVELGASPNKIKVWGIPIQTAFRRLENQERIAKREEIFRWLKFETDEPLILVAGGGEGLGKIEAIVKKLLDLPIQVAVLTGNNRKLAARCLKIGSKNRLRVLDWTEKVANLMQSADLIVSKLGLTFYEAMACGLPMIALEPPPGAELIQYHLLEKHGVGRAVRTLDEMSNAVGELIADNKLRLEMQSKIEVFNQSNASKNLVNWLEERVL